MRTLRAIVVGGLMMVVSAAPQSLDAQNGDRLDRAEEVRLARSAGPPAVSAEASVYVLERDGFVQAIDGSNGFVCLVVRSPGDAATLAPHCLDPLAAKTVLPAFEMEARMAAEGADASQIRNAVVEAFESGELELPSGPAYAYMLSSGQHLGQAGKWKPHFMMYVPYLTNADVGGDPSRPQFPFVGPLEGHPLSALVVVTTEFVDPSQVSDASR